MNKKLVLIILILCLANGVSALLPHGSKKVKFKVERIPLFLGGWQGSLREGDRLAKKILGTDDVYDFNYYKDGKQLQLSIVYYPAGQPAFHMPEGCTVGAGEKILSQERILVGGAWGDSETVYLRVLNNSGSVTHHVYAFASDEKLSADYIKFRLHLVGLSVRRNIQACALIRVSARQTDPARDTTEMVLREFWHEISIYMRRAMSLQ